MNMFYSSFYPFISEAMTIKNSSKKITCFKTICNGTEITEIMKILKATIYSLRPQRIAAC